MKVSSLLAIKKEALGIDFISSINVLGEWTVPKLKKSIMSSFIIRPNSLVSIGNFNVTDASVVVSRLSDENDSSFISNNAIEQSLTVGLEDTILESRFTSLSATARIKDGQGKGSTCTLAIISDGTNIINQSFSTNSNAFEDKTTNILSLDDEDKNFINALQFKFTADTGQPIVSELFVTVDPLADVGVTDIKLSAGKIVLSTGKITIS